MVMVRFMIQAARNKRCVTYVEIENIFGLNRAQAGCYAGMLGNYCMARKLPPLNALIVNSTNGHPSDGFDWYKEQYDYEWGDLVSWCWKEFHLKSPGKKQVQQFSGRDIDVKDFLVNRVKRSKSD